MMVLDIKNKVRTVLEASAGTISKMIVKGNAKGAEAVILEKIRPVIIQELKESSYKCIDSITFNIGTGISDDNGIIELTQNIVNELKDSIKDGSFSKKDQSHDPAALSKATGTSVAAGVFSAVTSILNPVLEVVLILAPMIVMFMKSLFGKSVEQQARDEFVGSTIPQILNSLDAPLRKSVEESQKSITEYMKKEINGELHSLEENIHHIEEIKTAEKEALETEKSKADAEIMKIKNIIKDMEE